MLHVFSLHLPYADGLSRQARGPTEQTQTHRYNGSSFRARLDTQEVIRALRTFADDCKLSYVADKFARDALAGDIALLQSDIDKVESNALYTEL